MQSRAMVMTGRNEQWRQSDSGFVHAGMIQGRMCRAVGIKIPNFYFSSSEQLNHELLDLFATASLPQGTIVMNWGLPIVLCYSS